MKKPRKPLAVPAKKTLNPFEVHINKQKMTVLGRKTKNDRGLPGVSRAKALKKRKDTLLQEYKLQHKSNRFTDKRIGERNLNMTDEDKVVARYTAIRKKAHKKSIFNLADDEVLTHKGQTLAEIEKFDDPRSDDEDSLEEGKSGNLDANFVEDAHFGGGILRNTGKEGAKTHRELIDELIAESKKRKAEKQKVKEATLELTEKLDTEWKDLLPLVSKTQKKEEEKMTVDDYDKVMRELKFEARGTVSDRLKTEDEIAREENQKLEELEQERQERMKGFEETEKKNTHRSADDLDDDLVYESDPEYMLSYNTEGEANLEIDAQINGKNVGESHDDDEEEPENEEEAEGAGAEEDDTASEEDDDLSDLKDDTSEESDVEETQETQPQTIEPDGDSLKKQEMMEKARQELPYTFNLPDSYESLQSLLENQTPSHQGVIIERMIKCNHPSLAEKNKQGLKVLFAYLLQHLNDCAEDSMEKCYTTFSVLAPHLFDLTQLDKENAYHSIKEVIKEKHEEFRKSKKKYPGLEILIFLKLVSLLFPTSDFRHQVVTPCFVFIEQMLYKCRIKSRKDIAYGLFLVTLVLEYTTLSKRYLPAAINYLGGILHMAVPKIGVKLIKVNPPFQPTTNSLVLFNDCTSEDSSLKMRLSDLAEEKIDDLFKIRALNTTLKLIEEFDNNFSALPSNLEIFKDILAYMELLPTRNYPQKVCTQFERTSQQLKSRRSDKNLDYVVMPAKRPKALRLYEPKIEEVFDGKRRKVQSKEKAERDKLLHKLKKETKGALREIRRDKSFLGRVKIQRRMQSDNERREKVKRIYSEAAMQQSELNSLERKNKRKK
ncbi:hypothetical protein Zmor_026095 [Zophobas morio]|uniref:Nucleolar protein 14 n=1 Tax=Zophobas morio TaxID=2755281 RepID=A0AA38HTX6_9CUCU|nr:hypothetical protein Zmor_026095 [Zophobas morio]